ncbi:MAG: M48 family metallopeptidase [Alphaproteobacteria bacterium]|nr:M48 family metallopeptidase [Alphaproteobacteria bacterium]
MTDRACPVPRPPKGARAPVLGPALRLVLALVAGLVLLAPRPAAAISGIRDAEIEHLLHDMCDPILRAAGLDPKAVNFYILNDPSLNAFVANGQNIFLHTGLILAAETPNELIGVVAHETGHISGGHLVRSSEAMSGATVPLLISMIAGIAAAAAGAPDVGTAIMVGSQTIAQRSVLAYSRGQESAADQAAVKFLDATGQSGRGILAFFDRFRDQEVLSGRTQDPYVRTHPLSSDRIAALDYIVKQSPNYETKDRPEFVARFALAKAKLRGFLERQDLVLQRYPLTDKSEPAHYARAIAYYRIPDLPAALKEVDALIAADPKDPFYQELKGQILFENGRIAEAIPFHREAVRLAPNEPLLHVNLGQAILGLEDQRLTPALVAEARGTLQEAMKGEPDNPFAWRQLAIAYAYEGDEPMAALATAERFYYSGQAREAGQFAQRALRDLPVGSVPYNRANDIVNAVRGAAGQRRDRDENLLPESGP